MIETIIIVVVLAAISVFALALGRFWGVRVHRERVAEARALAEARERHIREESARAIELVQRESQALVREEELQIAREADAEGEAIQEQIERLRGRISRDRQRVGAQEDALEDRRCGVDARFKEIRLQRDANKAVRDEAKRLRGDRRAVLEERAGESAEVLAKRIGDALIEETRSESEDRLRNLEASVSEDLTRAAKRVMGISIARYTGHCPRDRGVSNMSLVAGQATRLRDDLAPLVDKLSEELGIHITIADSGESLRMDTGDGVAREVCRRALTRFLRDKEVRDSDKILASLRADLDREIVRLGKKALSKFGLATADPEVIDLLGRLNWRTSYTQNQYWHAVEAGTLAGLMAAELGLDQKVARRAALLHDIGKAQSHAIDGSHALNGAEVARRGKESDLIVNAIAAHHGEEPMQTAYAWLTAAADAMSGGRPGARREIVESYGDRIGDLERIANRFRGVATVHAVQAGRELRVIVDERRVDDTQLDKLSSEIAEKISDEMTFPGQIRVTVIREFCATAVAN
ncbi:MAG: HDIG domain-containing protein [Deltaproteobacteria bacterium]|nr:HDIG domain-containing protein [Deltaproteobacteria bacterium]